MNEEIPSFTNFYFYEMFFSLETIFKKRSKSPNSITKLSCKQNRDTYLIYFSLLKFNECLKPCINT